MPRGATMVSGLIRGGIAMSFSELVSPLVGRFVLAWFFVVQAVTYAGTWDATIQLLALRNVPAPPAMLALALMVIALGSASLALGYHTRYGAMLLFAFTVTTSIVMHDYWNIAKPVDRMADYDLFTRDMAIAGSLLVLVGLGPGGFAIDNRVGGGKRK
jgi:putative oxidoreductase